ncbi:MAG: HEAT repeat domain-containing protein [Phycisphaerae bacterium]
MKRTLAMLFPVVLLTGSVVAQSTKSAVSPAEQIAAESLRHSATNLLLSKNKETGRAGRLLSLIMLADKLDPDDYETRELMRIVLATGDERDKRIANLHRMLVKKPDDHPLGMLWLELSDSKPETAEKRIDLLSSVVDDRKVPDSVRAEAAVRWANLLEQQAKDDQAATIYKRALKLDPHHPGALEGRLTLKESPTKLDRLDMLIGVLKGNPHAAQAGQDLGVLLGELSRHEDAVDVLGYLWKLDEQNPMTEQRNDDLAVLYFNALLDAGLSKKATEVFLPKSGEAVSRWAVRSLLIEAYRDLDNEQTIESILDLMEDGVASLKTAAAKDPAKALVLAWHYLLDRQKPATAMTYAKMALKQEPEDDAYRLVYAATQVEAGNEETVKKGRKTLTQLCEEDVYAAAFLARSYLRTDETEAARKCIAQGFELTRRGRAFRMLRESARELNYEIATLEQRQAAANRLKVAELEKTVFNVGLNPGKHLKLSFRPLQKQYVVGQPIEVEVKLENTSDVPVPLGSWGVMSPVVNLIAEIPPNRKIHKDTLTYASLPVVTFPAPKYLRPGLSIKRTVRVDSGPLDDELNRRPMDEITISLRGLVDPIQKDREFISRTPDITAVPLKITRTDILGEIPGEKAAAWESAMKSSMRQMLQDLSAKDPRTRVLAARQIAALTATYYASAERSIYLPEMLRGRLPSTMVLALLREALRSKSPVVRAETLAALRSLAVTPGTVPLLRTLVEDKSPLVRFRMAELAGMARNRSLQSVLERYREDSDPDVRRMAKAFRK